MSGLWLALLLALTACGFQLRGSSTLPERFNPLYLQADDVSPQQRAQISAALRRASADLVETSDQANRLEVRIHGGQVRRVVQSAAGVNELFRIDMGLDYRLLAADGSEQVATRSLNQSVDIELDSGNVLAHEQRLAEAREDLVKGLIRNMIFQLNRR